MRILIDESLPRRFAAAIPGHDVASVRQQRWTGLRNGVLLRAALSAGFEVLVTADTSLPYQQNLRSIGIAVVVITKTRNRLADLQRLVPEILEALAMIKPGDVIQIPKRPRDLIADRVGFSTPPLRFQSSRQ